MPGFDKGYPIPGLASFCVHGCETQIFGSALKFFAPDRPERRLSGDGYGVFERMVHKHKAESSKLKV